MVSNQCYRNTSMDFAIQFCPSLCALCCRLPQFECADSKFITMNKSQTAIAFKLFSIEFSLKIILVSE